MTMPRRACGAKFVKQWVPVCAMIGTPSWTSIVYMVGQLRSKYRLIRHGGPVFATSPFSVTLIVVVTETGLHADTTR